GKQVFTLDPIHANRTGGTVSPDGKTAVSWGYGDYSNAAKREEEDKKTGTLQVWDLTTGKEKRQIVVGQGAVQKALISPSGKQVAVMNIDYALRLFDLETGKLTKTFAGRRVNSMHLAYSADGKLFGTVGPLGEIQAWDVMVGKRLPTKDAPRGAFCA